MTSTSSFQAWQLAEAEMRVAQHGLMLRMADPEFCPSSAELNDVRVLRMRADELLQQVLDRPREGKPLIGMESITPSLGKHVLVVEDDPDVAEIACELLGVLGFTSVRVERAIEALDLLDAGVQFGLVMTDNQMPGMTGHELASEIRKRWSQLPVFIVTGRPQRFSVPHLQKPYSGRQLLDMIDSIQSADGAAL